MCADLLARLPACLDAVREASKRPSLEARLSIDGHCSALNPRKLEGVQKDVSVRYSLMIAGVE